MWPEPVYKVYVVAIFEVEENQLTIQSNPDPIHLSYCASKRKDHTGITQRLSELTL